MRHVIMAPIVTEKSAQREVDGVYTFKVHATATKPEVEMEFRKLFGADFEVAKVAMANVIKKTRQVGRSRVITKRKAYKKATIYLKSGSKPLDLTKLSA